MLTVCILLVGSFSMTAFAYADDTDQSHCCIEAAAAGSVPHIAVRKCQTVMIRGDRVLRHIRRLFAVIEDVYKRQHPELHFVSP